MKKEAYFVEVLPDGVAIVRGSTDGKGRPVLQADPAVSLVCAEARMAANLASVILEGRNWAKVRNRNLDIYVSGMGYGKETDYFIEKSTDILEDERIG